MSAREYVIEGMNVNRQNRQQVNLLLAEPAMPESNEGDPMGMMAMIPAEMRNLIKEARHTPAITEMQVPITDVEKLGLVLGTRVRLTLEVLEQTLGT